VIRVDFDHDLKGWRPAKGQTDKLGQLIDDRIYNQRDFDKKIVMEKRTELVAATITEFLQKTDPMQKTIVFCDNIDHAERMRSALVNLNPEQVRKNRKYVMRITGDEQEGKAELDNFIDPESDYPVIACTSKLMTTGVDAKTCKLVVLDQRIQSMTEFKQIIGRGTRIDEEYGKFWFTILDFKKATELFADEKFDGLPEQIYKPKEGETIVPPENPGGDESGKEGEDETENPGQPGIGEETGGYTTGGSDTGGDSGGNTAGADGSDGTGEPPVKFFVNDVEFKKIDQRVQYLDASGKLITENLTDFTRKSVQGQYATLNDFINRWHNADRKQAMLDELAAQGIFWQDLADELKDRLGDEPDPFDVILHIVYGQPALTRKQRASNARKRKDVFSRYQDSAQAVLDALLDKYADNGIASIEDIKILRLPPFDQLGTAPELVKAFGGKPGYQQALKELEDQLYQDDAS
jgi:type I restriction enzyme, R subunit